MVGQDQTEEVLGQDRQDGIKHFKYMVNTSVCIRCGKSRIEGKSWTESLNGSKVTYTQTVCPDKECQKIVDKQLLDKKNKIDKIQKDSLDRRSKIRRGKKRG